MPLLYPATQQYLQFGIDKPKTFHQAALRNAGVVIDICGDKVKSEYIQRMLVKCCDILIERGLNVLSVKRAFTTVRSIINLSISEHGLDIRNAFSSIYMPEAISKTCVYSSDTIREIQQACFEDDEKHSYQNWHEISGSSWSSY